jgi:hypothetical protein
MLQLIDPGALSYRRNGSISTESALATAFHLLLEARLQPGSESSVAGKQDGNENFETLEIKRASSSSNPQPIIAVTIKRPIREPQPTWNFDADPDPILLIVCRRARS